MNDDKQDSIDKIMNYLSNGMDVLNKWRRDDSRYELWTAVFYFATVLLLVGAVVFLAYRQIIDGSITATLLSGIIGYTLGKGSTYIHSKNSKK